MQKRTIIGIVSVVVILLLGTGLSILFIRQKPEDKKPPPKDIRRVVKVDTIYYSQVQTEMVLSGRVLAQQETEIIAEVQGTIQPGQVPLKKGADFNKGQILFTLFSDDIKYALQARKSSFLNALANILPDLKIDFPEAFPKWETYFQSVEITEPLPPLPEINGSKEKMFLSSRNIVNTYYNILSEEERLKKYTIYAPFNGSYLEVMLQEGSVANPGSRVARVIKQGALEVEIPVPANDIQWVSIGREVHLKNRENNRAAEGRVVRISSFINENTQTFSVFAEINNPFKNQIFPGQYVQTVFSDIYMENAMEIPRNAIFNFNQVFILDSLNRLKKQQINVLKRGGEMAFFNGPDTGLVLVTEPLANVKENTQVDIFMQKSGRP